MLIFKFTRNGEQHITPASNLLDAALTLPYAWTHLSDYPLTVTSTPATDTDYWKARCQLMEQQLQRALRRT